MNYKVVWLGSAKERLAKLLANSKIQVAVIRAVYRVDAILGYFPELVGESRGTNKRVVFEEPLTVYYRIDEAAKNVRIFRILIPRL